jgi:hypothetical protein
MVSRNPPRTGAASASNPDDRSGAEQAGDQKGHWPQSFNDAAAEYMTTVSQIGSRLQDKHRSGLEGLHQMPRDGAQPNLNEDLARAYNDLIDAIQKQDLERVKMIQSNYLSRVLAAYTEAETNQRNRQTEYVNALQSAWQSARSELTAAFQAYLNAVKSSFAKLPDSIDPATVAAIGHSLTTVASYAHSAAQAMPAAPSKT